MKSTNIRDLDTTKPCTVKKCNGVWQLEYKDNNLMKINGSNI